MTTPEFAHVAAALEARGPGRMQPDLERITALMDLLGFPQRAYPCIHITGTNGKTSTARMVDALLRAFGLRTGRYLSPHLESVTERIALSGEPISPEAFAAVYAEVSPYLQMVDERVGPMTYFEVLTGMAYAAFADAPVDVGVIEVGLGGKWDATNVIEAPVAVVTPVGLDHQQYLGDTLAEIAREKAGIVHAGSTLVMAAQAQEAAVELLRRAGEMQATVAREGVEFGVAARAVAVGGQQLTLSGLGGVYEDVFLPLYGAHQAGNAACALAAVEAFLGGGAAPLDLETVRAGFASADSPGRLERVRTSPTVLLDGAHNAAGARALAAALEESFDFRRLVAIVAVLDDKDVAGMLEALDPVVDVVVATVNGSPRALPVDDLAAVAVDILGADRVEVAGRLDDAVDQAVAIAEEEGDLGAAGVVITGSLVTVGEARRLLAR